MSLKHLIDKLNQISEAERKPALPTTQRPPVTAKPVTPFKVRDPKIPASARKQSGDPNWSLTLQNLRDIEDAPMSSDASIKRRREEIENKWGLDLEESSDQLNELSPETLARYRKAKGAQRDPNWKWNPEKEAERQAHNAPIDKMILRALDKEMAARRREAGVDDNYRPIKKNSEQGVAEGIKIVDQDSDLDQQVYTLNVDGNKVSFTYWDYENNFQSPDIKDIYQQATEQLGRKLSPDQIKDVARAVFKSFEQGVAEGADVEYVVVIRDEQGKRSIRISALTPTDAKEKAKAQGYKVLKVKDPQEANYFSFRDQGVAEGLEENRTSQPSNLKEWMKHVEQSHLMEMQQQQPGRVVVPVVKPRATVATQQPKSSGSLSSVDSSEQRMQARSKTDNPAALDTAVLALKNPSNPLAPAMTAAIRQAVGKGQVAVVAPQQSRSIGDSSDTESVGTKESIGEQEVYEVSPPGMKHWIEKHKSKFIDQYGKEKGTKVAFATAWDMYNKKKKTESVDNLSKPVMEGYTLEDVLKRYPHEHKACQEGWGMHEGLYEALCDHYYTEGRIPYEVWHGPLEELRNHVEQCYLKDTKTLIDEQEEHLDEVSTAPVKRAMGDFALSGADTTGAGAIAGGAVGRKAGAAIGSLVGPVGTAVGAGVGHVAGSIVGDELERTMTSTDDDADDADDDDTLEMYETELERTLRQRVRRMEP